MNLSDCWRLKSWDRFAVPKPFSKVTFYADKILDISGMTTDEAKAFIAEEMLKNALE